MRDILHDKKKFDVNRFWLEALPPSHKHRSRRSNHRSQPSRFWSYLESYRRVFVNLVLFSLPGILLYEAGQRFKPK